MRVEHRARPVQNLREHQARRRPAPNDQTDIDRHTEHPPVRRAGHPRRRVVATLDHVPGGMVGRFAGDGAAAGIQPRTRPGWTLSRSLGYQGSRMAPPHLTLPALILGAALLAAAPAFAATGVGGPNMQPILLALVLMILGARLGGSAAERFGQPAGLGGVAAGIAVRNLSLVGYHGLQGL